MTSSTPQTHQRLMLWQSFARLLCLLCVIINKCNAYLLIGVLNHPAKCIYIIFFVCLYLSSIHKKTNCIVVFWTEYPHSLGSCRFRGVWATSEVVVLFFTTSLKCRAPSREAMDIIFKVFWYDSTWKMNPRPTDREADTLTTTVKY